ncbi:calcium-transporting ATPase [Thiomicrorhabdus immobilis]|uniref:Calcium-transporting ATPase n=1 Tax=Thiomicrorhabdus immobilis TaxID=2791037 RepID=A0ABN6D1Y5_9GAMM|nr:cation-translocating P-type ATPase [Thiomicrorhabdus immobilis]BCN94202.1 calcium-transporting ATPase [Thiomicrorhabdus immobilis]
MDWFKEESQHVIDSLGSNAQNGLDDEQIIKVRNQFGLNQIIAQKSIPPLWRFILQFKNPLLIILMFGAFLSFITSHYIDTIAITIIILLNAIISFVQEYRAQKSIDALRQMAAPKTIALRNKQWQTIAASELVPGDIVRLDAGSIVPADLRLIETQQLKIDESALTGESEPVGKHTLAILQDNLPITDQLNMAFMSTAVTEGQGFGIVVGTGMQTEVGKIAHLMQIASTNLTPLQQRVHRLSKVLILAALIVVMIVVSIGLMHGMSWSVLMTTGISLAVAATPEGLMTILTIVLTLGATRMMQNKGLVRHLASVETLGSTSIICTDKTGTLTQNKMQVTQLWTGGLYFHLEGQGYEPIGQFLDHNLSPISHKDIRHLEHMVTLSVLCNEAEHIKKDGSHSIIGSPTEGAILVAAAKTGMTKEAALEQYTEVVNFPFDSKRKMMSVIVEDKQNQYWLIVKGAPDVMIENSEAVQLHDSLGDMLTDKPKVEAVVENFANQALRTLAIGYRKLQPSDLQQSHEELETNLTLAGIYGIIDPPRSEAIKAIDACHSAGIKVAMITGDHAITAKAIALKMGIITDENARVLEGKTLNQMSDEALFEEVENISVFARVTPEHKLRIVQALQKHNHVVAMTGDGVNDAPALRTADMGVAMGITGTGVSKESADLILLDDNFTTIVEAVKEGRRIYDNIRKFIRQDLTTNVGEVSALLFAFILISDEPLLTLAPLMILWINLISDGLPSLALGVDGAEDNVMKRLPRDKNESFFAGQLGQTILIRGLIMGGVTYGMFLYAINLGLEQPYAQTLAFMTLIFGQLVQVFDSRTITNIYHRNPFSNRHLLIAVAVSGLLSIMMVYTPFGNLLLGTMPLRAEHLGLAFLVGALPVLILSAINETFNIKWL